MFSLSADVTRSACVAAAGMALLDAAEEAERLQPRDPILVDLSEARRFEPMPGDEARFVDSEEVRRALRRPISGAPEDAHHILLAVVAAVARR